MRLGRFLVSRDLVTVNEIVKALEIQRQKQRPLGRIAFVESLLTLDQVATIIDLQSDGRETVQDDRASDLFGELAIQLGYLAEHQVEELLNIQRRSRPRIGEILVEMGAISEFRLNAALQDFQLAALA